MKDMYFFAMDQDTVMYLILDKRNISWFLASHMTLAYDNLYNEYSNVCTVEPCLTATLLVRSPCYYDHFILARKKAQSVIFLFKEPINTASPLTRPDFYGSLVTGLLGFHCV